MTDLIQTINFDAIDFSQVIAEDRGDDERNMDFLLRPRAGVQFVPVIEADEIVEDRAFPPRPETIKAVVKAYQDLVAIHGPENVITICPFKDKLAGVKELNNAIRASLSLPPAAPLLPPKLHDPRSREPSFGSGSVSETVSSGRYLRSMSTRDANRRSIVWLCAIYSTKVLMHAKLRRVSRLAAPPFIVGSSFRS